MKRAVIAPPTLPPPRGFSHGILVRGGALLFLAGQDASDTQGHITTPGNLVGQFAQVLQNLKAVAEAAGGTLQDVMKLNIYVRDRNAYLANLKPLGQIFRIYFGTHYPAMALVEVSGFFRKEALIEMEGMAVVEQPSAGKRATMRASRKR